VVGLTVSPIWRYIKERLGSLECSNKPLQNEQAHVTGKRKAVRHRATSGEDRKSTGGHNGIAIAIYSPIRLLNPPLRAPLQ